ncbi:MAG TPA: TIGR03435 family protein, partial [Acidobacteriaceae bacterium]|nr:TIGR03435 family protein [Acidobacteriaceae bacterium]
MVRCLFALSVLAVAGGSLSARNAVQTPQPANAPAFTLADVHPSPWVNFPYTHGGILRGDRYALRQATMVDLISTAYGIDPSRVDGGPSWLAFDRYDIVAQAPAGTSRAALRLMLRSLLATRFHLAAHNGDAPLPAWALIAVKPKLAESPGGNSECSPQPPPPDVISAGIPMVAFGCHNMPMDQFVQILQPLGGDYFENKPVVDSTGLTG